MDVIDFVNSIYLGDRGCKKIIVDGWSDEVSVQVDSISRVRSSDGQWNFYTDEDIDDGFIVFEKVKRITWDPSGRVPNGFINWLDVEKQDENLYLFSISIESYYGDKGLNEEAILKILAESICLRDPLKPDQRITD